MARLAADHPGRFEVGPDEKQGFDGDIVGFMIIIHSLKALMKEQRKSKI
jgi:hypothetical protein